MTPLLQMMMPQPLAHPLPPRQVCTPNRLCCFPIKSFSPRSYRMSTRNLGQLPTPRYWDDSLEPLSRYPVLKSDHFLVGQLHFEINSNQREEKKTWVLDLILDLILTIFLCVWHFFFLMFLTKLCIQHRCGYAYKFPQANAPLFAIYK